MSESLRGEEARLSSAEGAEPKHGVSHERRDVNPRIVILFTLGLVIILVSSQAGLYWLTNGIWEREARSDPEPSPLRASAPRLPPTPRLQTAPKQDMAEFRAREEALLGTYGRREDGRIRIPVDRAMEILVTRGLPVRATKPTGENKATVPRDSGLGRAER